MERILKEMKSPKKRVKNTSADSLKRSIDRHLSKKNSKYHRKISGFHPSYNNLCKRWWVLLFNGAESKPKFTPRTLRIFDNGHAVHERWRQYFDSMGILVGSEVPVVLDDPVPIRGSADGVIDWGGNKLYELKSISPERYEFRKAYNKPDSNTYRQIQLYLSSLNYDTGFIIYESKGNQDFKVFSIDHDEAFVKKELRKLQVIYKYVEENKIPKRPYVRESKQCSECDLEDFCWDVLKD